MEKTPGQKEGLMTTRCSECKAIFDCLVKFDGKFARCPKCGEQFQVSVYLPQSSPKPPIKPKHLRGQPDSDQPTQTLCGLGIASIALGVVACVTCWIPLVGGVSVPVALLGIFFGIAGGVVAMTTKRNDGYLAGCGVFVCLTAVVVFVFAQAWFSAEVDKIMNVDFKPMMQKNNINASLEFDEGFFYVVNDNSHAWTGVKMTANGEYFCDVSMIPGRDRFKVEDWRFIDGDGIAMNSGDYEDVDILIETDNGDCWIR